MFKFRIVTLALTLLLTGCGGGGSASPSGAPPKVADGASPPAATFSIGGTVRGLRDGASLTVNSGAGASLAIASNGDFVFPVKAASGTAYHVTIGAHPAGQVCTVGAASGTLADADIRKVEILCNAASTTVEQSRMAVVRLAGYAGSQGAGDGDAAQATFACPFGLTTDSARNLYVTDAQGYSVRQITPAGVVGTLAREIRSPGGIARDQFGNLYVADTINDAIVQISPSGAVSDFVRFYKEYTYSSPVGVTIDTAGNLYVAGRGKHVILKISSSGAVTSLAGTAGIEGAADGHGSAARFKTPFGVAIDANGNLYVSDEGNHTIRRITAAGTVTTLAGAPGVAGAVDGIGAAARFRNPSGIAIGMDGNLYVVDNGNRRVRMVTPEGTVSTVAGAISAVAGGYATPDSFEDPYGIAVDSAGILYVSDCGNHTISKLVLNEQAGLVTVTPPPSVFPASGIVTTLAGKVDQMGAVDGQGSAARFNEPGLLIVDHAGNIIVGDGWPSNLLRKVSPSGAVTTLAGTQGSWHTSTDGVGSQASFDGFRGLAIDGAGNIYTPGTGTVGGTSIGLRKITPAGSVTTIDVPIYGGHPLRAIVADAAGDIYAIDNSRIDKIRMSPMEVSVFAGDLSSFDPRKHFDGAPDLARFDGPIGIVVDTHGNIFVTDTANLVIRKISPEGFVTTFAGRVGKSGTAPGYGSAHVDGTGETARFHYPVGLAIDGANNLYVTDNYTIRKISPDRTVRTIAGLAGVKGSVDGVGAAARFGQLFAIAADKAGVIYVTDNQTVRKIVQQ